MRLPVRIAVGNGSPVDVGTWELRTDESGTVKVDSAAFADVLRAAADELAPNPADVVYRERARLVANLASLHPSVMAPAVDVDEPGWHIVYINSSAGQMSWHIAPADHDLFAHLEHVDSADPRAQWDGHTTPEKYERLAALATGRR